MSRRPCPPTAGEEWARAEEERKNRTEEKKEKEKKEEEEEEEGVREETRANAPVPAAEIGGEAGGASVTTSVTTSAMAAMMGTTPTNRGSEPIAAPVVTAAAVAPGEVPRSSMARLLSAPSAPSAPSSAPAGDDDDDDAKALRAASRVAEKLRAAPVPLAELFPHWHRAKGVVNDEVEPVPTSGTKRVAGGHAWAQRKNKEEAERAAVAAIEDGAGDVVTRTPGAKAEADDAEKTKTKDAARVTLPGGTPRPPRFARAPSASVRSARRSGRRLSARRSSRLARRRRGTCSRRGERRRWRR